MRFLFGDYVLDLERRELRRGGDLVQVEPQVFDLLAYLVAHRDRVASKDDLLAAVWHGRIVSESTLTSRITAARHAIGDSGEQQRFIRTVSRRGFRFVGEVREQPPAVPAAKPDHAPAQEVSFCRTAEGINLAVAVCGHGLPVVKTANWMNHVEFDWQSPVWSPLLRRLAEQFRLIRYDERGTGLSDWDVADISFETFVRDLETVVDALRLDRFALFGNAQGAAVAIVYAVRHPERVSRLVLSGGYAQGWRARGNPAEIEGRKALLKLIEVGWGQDNPAFRQVFTSLMIPGGTLEQAQWVNDLQRVSTSPKNAARLLQVFGDIDVTQFLPRVTAPTLVLHSRGDSPCPFEQGLMLARGIPNARFVALESRNNVILSHEPTWGRSADEICAFLAEDRAYSGAASKAAD
jgi:DNA-binding winged helix-turn-helix (wHTH) protein/pimeloyl-ACP methyl ester carboxylesterase